MNPSPKFRPAPGNSALLHEGVERIEVLLRRIWEGRVARSILEALGCTEDESASHSGAQVRWNLPSSTPKGKFGMVSLHHYVVDRSQAKTNGKGAMRTFPIRFSEDPLMVLKQGEIRTIKMSVETWAGSAEVEIQVAVGRKVAPLKILSQTKGFDESVIQQLPDSASITGTAYASAIRLLTRMASSAPSALNEAIRQGVPKLRSMNSKVQSQIASQGQSRMSSSEDAMLAGMKRIGKLAERWAGPNRPWNVTWDACIYRGCRRDMLNSYTQGNDVSQLDYLIERGVAQAIAVVQPEAKHPASLMREMYRVNPEEAVEEAWEICIAGDIESQGKVYDHLYTAPRLHHLCARLGERPTMESMVYRSGDHEESERDLAGSFGPETEPSFGSVRPSLVDMAKKEQRSSTSGTQETDTLFDLFEPEINEEDLPHLIELSVLSGICTSIAVQRTDITEEQAFSALAVILDSRNHRAAKSVAMVADNSDVALFLEPYVEPGESVEADLDEILERAHVDVIRSLQTAS